MEYVKLGNSGLEVSKVCLGCMGFGDVGVPLPKNTLGFEASREIIRHAIKQGINFFDTANIYSHGSSEEYLGRVINEAITEGSVKRQELVIATKVYTAMYDGPNSFGLSRKTVLHEVEESLKRLNLDYIDLYIIHRLDHTTPITEIMSTLHGLVQSGKVRYIGASSMSAWEFLRCQLTARSHGWTEFISMQAQQNLLYREEEREMVPLCLDLGVGMTPWSPLQGGLLVRDLTKASARFSQEMVEKMEAKPSSDIERSDREIIMRVGQVAEKYHCSKTEVALGWLLSKNYITAPIVGASDISHVDLAIKACDINLKSEDIAFLEEPYIPRAPFILK